MLEPKPSLLSFRVLVFYSGSGVVLTPGMWRRESCSPAAQQVQGQHKLHQRFCLKSPCCASKDPSLLCAVLSTFFPVCSSHPAMKSFFPHFPDSPTFISGETLASHRLGWQSLLKLCSLSWGQCGSQA